MNRISPFLWLALDLLLGFALYETKYAVQRLEDDRVKIDRQIALDRDQIHVLNAEWSFLTQPDRLGRLAGKFLSLQPLTAAQLGAFDTLPLKGDDPAVAANDRDVPISEVLKAMQIAATPPAVQPAPATKARAVE
ncbi:MAG TPA: hypothetical protein VKS60_11310 [Stellaceae bacterium]|nr:hypothetical protein [Stellaceae bacterium]